MHPTTVSATATYLQYQCTCVWLLLLKILTSILLQHCRSQAALACPMWAKQCDHIPQRSLVQTLVLVVLANLATGPVLAQATLGWSWVSQLKQHRSKLCTWADRKFNCCSVHLMFPQVCCWNASDSDGGFNVHSDHSSH
jgi:hypothetical protein